MNVEHVSTKVIMNKRYYGSTEMEMKNGLSKAATKLGFAATGATNVLSDPKPGEKHKDANNASYPILDPELLSKVKLQELYSKIELLNDPAYKGKEEEFKAHQNEVVRNFYNKYGVYLTEEQTLELLKEVNVFGFNETRIRLSTVYHSDSKIGDDWKENFDFSRDANGKVISKTPNGKFSCTISSKWVYISNDYTVDQCKDGTILNLIKSQELRESIGTINRFSSTIELSSDGYYRLRMNTPKD